MAERGVLRNWGTMSSVPLLVTREDIAEEILSQLERRGVGKTICPSEVARALSPSDWRGLMESVRSVAFELSEKNGIAILQKGGAVDPATVKGPIRLGLRE